MLHQGTPSSSEVEPGAPPALGGRKWSSWAVPERLTTRCA
jgi:hypothetical protein